MRAFKAYLAKEFCVITRSYKLFILVAVFTLLDIMNPITAKLTPELWDTGNNVNTLFAAFNLYLYGILIISVILIGGVIFKQNYGCLLLTACFIGILSLLNFIPALKQFNPSVLSSDDLCNE